MTKIENSDAQDIIQLSRGIAMMVEGAGMVLANPAIRKLLMSSASSALTEGEDTLSAGLAVILPDLERYMRIRSM